MNREVIIYIRSNPAESHKPVEALRITAGLLASNVPVRLIVHPEVKTLFTANDDDLVDGNYRDQFLQVITNHGLQPETAESVSVTSNNFRIVLTF